MKVLFLIITALLLSFPAFTQDTLDVVEKTVKISGSSREKEYYGFAEGDKIVFSMEVDNRKELKDVSIGEYPDRVRFADHTVNSIENKVITVPRTGVYVFEFHNSNLSGRIATIRIRRIPASPATLNFNTNVKWVNRIDTSYVAKQVTYLDGADSSVVQVLDSKVQVHSTTNMANDNLALAEFSLPANTVRWSYWIGVNQEGTQAYQQDQNRVLKLGLKFMGSTEPLAGFALGLLSLSNASVGDNVQYYFLPTYRDALLFKQKNTFNCFRKGNVINDFGLIDVPNPLTRMYYVGLANDNLTRGIIAYVKVVAVVVNKRFRTVVENSPVYANNNVPVLQE